MMPLMNRRLEIRKTSLHGDCDGICSGPQRRLLMVRSSSFNRTRTQ
jgi:hypothetical protein